MSKDEMFQSGKEEETTGSFSDHDSGARIPKDQEKSEILTELHREPIPSMDEPSPLTGEQEMPSVCSEPAPLQPDEKDEMVSPTSESSSHPELTEEKENCEASPCLDEGLSVIQCSIGRVEENVKRLAESSSKIAGEVREMHKLYHNEFASRLSLMQDELDRYREIDKGRIFDGILGEVAKLYSDYESLIDDASDEKVKKRIGYMLEDIVQILQVNGVLKQKSNPGDKRNVRYCQVIERISTDTVELHDTVARSRGTGFYIENRSLIKEPVDIYLYTEHADDNRAEN